jgi:RsiW-degrading membrane proteinase PrsW (M82 family)
MTAINLELSEHESAALPRRVWAGMLGIYAIVMIALFSAGAPGDIQITTRGLILMTLAVNLALGGMLTAIFGGRIDVRRVMATCVFTLVLSVCAVWMIHWGDRHDAAHADTSRLAFPWTWIDQLQREAGEAHQFGRAFMAQVLGVAIFEEGIKLLPAMIFFATRRSRRVRSFMLSAAVGGLIFGLAESITYANLVYGRQGAPAWEYVMRCGASAPAHAFWSAIGAAVTCMMLSARFGRMVSILSGWSIAAILHGFHNASQASFGPVAQIPSLFVAMLLLFLAARWAWRVDGCREVEPSCTMVECL